MNKEQIILVINGYSRRVYDALVSIVVRLQLREIAEGVNMGGRALSDRDSTTLAVNVSPMSTNAINRLYIPALALDKPFNLLNNTELTMLYEILG